VLISHDFEVARQSIDLIVEAVESGRLSRARLEEAFGRVHSLRRKLQQPLALDAKPPYPGIGREIGRRAVTVIRGAAGADPKKSIVVTFEGATVEGVQGLHTEHASLAAGMPQLRLTLEPAEADVSAAIATLRDLGKRPVVLMRRAHVYGTQAQAVERVLDAFPDALFVSTREPFDALDLSRARNVLCTYGDDAPSMAGLADVIFGGAAPEGRYPLHGEAIAHA
jgi:hypothetical protein